MLRLVNLDFDDSIASQRMKDGEIGVVVQWGIWEHNRYYLNKIVQRYKKDLICLGVDSGKSWPNWFGGEKMLTDHRVRILNKDDLLQLEEKK